MNVGRPFLASSLPLDCQDYTYSIPDKEEIFNTLKDMKLNASAGPDGFNVEFYIATWSWIGDDVTAMVRNFYQTCIMPSHISDTHIALIPKKNWSHKSFLTIDLSAFAMSFIRSFPKPWPTD